MLPYARLYDDIMSGAVDASNHRHDLGSHLERSGGRRENICQVRLECMEAINPYAIKIQR